MTFYILQVLNGVTFAALLFLVASGFTLIFGLMRVANLTHGMLYLMAGYVALTIVRQTGNFALALVAAIIFAGVLGFLIERIFLHRVQGSILSEVLLTIGLAFILADIAGHQIQPTVGARDISQRRTYDRSDHVS